MPAKNDSAAVVRQFIANAKPILDSLTKLHFLRLELATVRTQLIAARGSAAGLRAELAAADQRNQLQQAQLETARAEAERIRRKAQRRGLENWLWRGAAGVCLYYLTIRSW